MLLTCGAGEDSWESLGLRKIKPVNPKGNQPWILIGRTDTEVEVPILWPPDAESTHWKRPWFWETLKGGGEGDNRRWDGWMASPTRWTWVWTLGVGDGQGNEVWCAAVHGVAKSRDMTEQLNWTQFIFYYWKQEPNKSHIEHRHDLILFYFGKHLWRQNRK